jgi:acetyl/propionyl-CoA carboxylase alpha subunit
VELQILSAGGQRLPDALEQVEVSGVAIEARICAEDAGRGFQPDSGRVFDCVFPAGNLRVDSGIEAGREVSPFYDSMLAKVIAHATTRDEAVDDLARGLDRLRIAGVETNAAYLRDVLDTEAFRAPDLSTHFLETHLDDWTPDPANVERLAGIAAGLYTDHLETVRSSSGLDTPWETLGAWRLTESAGAPGYTHLVLDAGGQRRSCRVSGRDGRFKVQGTADTVSIRVVERSPSLEDEAAHLRIEVDGIQSPALFFTDGDRLFVSVGSEWTWMRHVPRHEQYVHAAHQGSASESDVRAPYPGLITEVPVSAGDKISEGDVVAVMEAMKMIHHLAAPVDGVIKAVHCAPNESVETGALLIEFEPENVES